ncbi:hypothetical protein KY290_027536 [Solanum tuberosum]|uniref:Uncharacterized protein n=1 Tax=Solanum tuberosum TaxID=4113 RepID=A0ABQ7UFF7_SOLTU|nr:hypothetical protein KY285_026472 [Solanum tuberosum]KAH0748304.1 hypothetical protein KY290_027536 [Solanum tuberosum]
MVLSSNLQTQVRDNHLCFYHVGKNRNVNFPSSKRIFVTTAYETFEHRNHPSIEILLDECLFIVFNCFLSSQEISVCSCVSRSWLMILSRIHKDEIEESNGTEGKGYLVSSLFSREATYVKLASIVVGTANCGGLAKLSVRGNNPLHGMTDTGLEAIVRGYPTLRDRSLLDVSFVGDEGLSKIAHGYHLLKALSFPIPNNY